MEPRERFGGNVRAMRTRRGLSQEALAERCRLHPTEISRLERGVRDPRLATMVRIARALGVAPAELLEGVR